MLSMIIFLDILFLQVYTEDTFDCAGYENDSYHPISNTNNCRYYWHCIHVDTIYMKAIKRVCPAGTEFDIRLNECEISSLVNCVPMKLTLPKTRLSQVKVLSNTSTQLPPIFLLEQLLKKLAAIKPQSSINITEPEFDNTANQIFETTTTIEISSTTTTPPFLTSKLKRRHVFHRHNLTLNILTSNEHKIRHFTINQTHGILIQCNQLRRRQLRNLVFRTTPSTTTTIRNSSSKIYHLSLTIFINSFLFLQK